MRKALVVYILVLAVVIALCAALPAAAQEEAGEKAQEKVQEKSREKASSGGDTFKALAPVDIQLFKWLVGEWEGWSKSPMGETTDYMMYEMDLAGQFLVLHYKSAFGGMGVFSGRAYVTVLEDGTLAGFWVDSRRTMSRGKGSVDEDAMTMEWGDEAGVYRRITEKVDENTFTIKSTMIGPEEMQMEAVSEMKRLK